MNTQSNQDQMALDLGDLSAKLNVKDLIVKGQIDSPASGIRKPKPAPTHERALIDGADCAFRRRCGSKSELLVLLATQGQAYTMDERTGRRHALTPTRLATFCDGACGATLTPPWSDDPLQDYDRNARRALVELFETDDFCQLVRRDMVRVSAWDVSRRGCSVAWYVRGSWEHIQLMWKLIEPVIGHDAARDALTCSLSLGRANLDGSSYAAYELFRDSTRVHDLDDYLGRDRLRALVNDVLALAPYLCNGTLGNIVSAVSYVIGSVARHGVVVDKGRLCRHVLELLRLPPRRHSSRSSAVMAWASCIDDQIRARGRVFDLYPAGPRELSLQLEVERVESRDARANGRIRERAEALADKSYSDDNYLIRPVSSASELLEEAERQHNCLATYLEKVASGEADIWLMREDSDPDRPLVTVEVRDGYVRQAFRACNECPSEEELSWLAAWCERSGYRMHRGAMQALCA